MSQYYSIEKKLKNEKLEKRQRGIFSKDSIQTIRAAYATEQLICIIGLLTAISVIAISLYSNIKCECKLCKDKKCKHKSVKNKNPFGEKRRSRNKNRKYSHSHDDDICTELSVLTPSTICSNVKTRQNYGTKNEFGVVHVPGEVTKYAQFKVTCMDWIYCVFANDNDNHGVITMKFILLCIKPFCILLTDDPTEEKIFLILQLCSLLVMSYLTYSQFYLTVLMASTENYNHSQKMNRNFYLTICNVKQFGIHYLVSYLVTNFTSYFILAILIPYKVRNTNGTIESDWIVLVYIQYIWLFFAKLYHNEIVIYFNHVWILNKCENKLNIIKNEKTIDFCWNMINHRIYLILFWLKMAAVASFLCLWYWITWIATYNEKQRKFYEIGLIHLILSLSMLINCLLTFRLFKNDPNHSKKCCKSVWVHFKQRSSIIIVCIIFFSLLLVFKSVWVPAVGDWLYDAVHWFKD